MHGTPLVIIHLPERSFSIPYGRAYSNAPLAGRICATRSSPSACIVSLRVYAWWFISDKKPTSVLQVLHRRPNSDTTTEVPRVQSCLLSRRGAAVVLSVIIRTVLVEPFHYVIIFAFFMLWLTTLVVFSVVHVLPVIYTLAPRNASLLIVIRQNHIGRMP